MIKTKKAKFTGLEFSTIGFGASPFGNIYNDHVSEDQAKSLVKKAIENGITYFDVAPYYGLSRAEVVLGKSLPKKKNSIILSTKIGRYGENKFDFSKNTIERSINQSLKNLKTDHINIIFCHDIEFVPEEIIIQEALPTLQKLKQKGIISHIGISGYPLKLLSKISKNNIVDIVLSYGHYNILNQELFNYLEEFKKNNVDIINASPFCMGLLTKNNCPSWHPYKEKKEISKLIKNLPSNLNIEKESFQFTLNQNQFTTTLTGIAKEKDLSDILYWANNKINKKNQNQIKNMFKSYQNINWA